jgi:hypothetical protein
MYARIYEPKNYWVFGLFPSSGNLQNRKHDVSETGSVSVLKWEGKTPTQLVLLERANFNQWGRKQFQFPKRRVFYFIENRTIEKAQKPSNSVCYTPSSEPFRIYIFMKLGVSTDTWRKGWSDGIRTKQDEHLFKIDLHPVSHRNSLRTFVINSVVLQHVLLNWNFPTALQVCAYKLFTLKFIRSTFAHYLQIFILILLLEETRRKLILCAVTSNSLVGVRLICIAIHLGDLLCGLVVRNPEVSGSIPGATRFSEK